jgi:hypothetical protein
MLTLAKRIPSEVVQLTKRPPRSYTVSQSPAIALFVTMSALAFSRWSEDYHLSILGLLSFIAATIGRTTRRKLWPSWPRHMTGMVASYIPMITVFYADNESSLRLRRELPPLAFWILPTLIGAPILINTHFSSSAWREMGGRKV